MGGGRGGGTQYRNTVRKIGKYRNTVSKIDEIPIPHFMIGHAYLTFYPTRNQPQPSRENVTRSRIDRYSDRKARLLDVLSIPS